MPANTKTWSELSVQDKLRRAVSNTHDIYKNQPDLLGSMFDRLVQSEEHQARAGVFFRSWLSKHKDWSDPVTGKVNLEKILFEDHLDDWFKYGELSRPRGLPCEIFKLRFPYLPIGRCGVVSTGCIPPTERIFVKEVPDYGPGHYYVTYHGPVLYAMIVDCATCVVSTSRVSGRKMIETIQLGDYVSGIHFIGNKIDEETISVDEAIKYKIPYALI